jgi:hypothetical protein
MSEKSMHTISFRDNTFSTADCHLYDLSVHCSPDGISFLVQQSGSGSLLHCGHQPFKIAGYQMLLRKIRDLIAGNDFFNLPFRKTTILFGDRHVSLVPESLWSEKLSEYIHLTGKKQEVETESIVVSLHQMGAYLVFRTGKELFDTLNLIFPCAEITHEVVPLLQHLQPNTDSRLLFHMHSSWFYALSVKEGKLEFINSFDYQSETDMLYYMLSVISEFNSGNHPVVISGWIDRDDPRFILIKKHIPGAFPAYQNDEDPLSDRGLAYRYFNYFLH